MVRVITLLCGDNDYELTKKVAQLKTGFTGTVERFDAPELSREQLADIFAGQTLFATNRMILLDNPSGNTDLWQELPTWVERLDGATEILLIESKPDKRTSTYKWLKKNAEVQEYSQPDDHALATWVATYANEHGVRLTSAQTRRLIDRAGTDQWELAHAIDKLSLAGEVSDQWIDDVTQLSPNQNVFALFEIVLNGDRTRLAEAIVALKATEEPYRVLALINAQALQLAALVYGDGNASKVAADLGAKSAYPYQKLTPYATRLSKGQAKRMLEALASSDIRLKSSDAGPWLVLENTLARLASLMSE
jgi:DNA polymerase III delta subunit